MTAAARLAGVGYDGYDGYDGYWLLRGWRCSATANCL
jgi:hypothetical protein